MKNIRIIIITWFITTLGFAQNGINYKALIKDDSGNVVANSSVDIKFKILESNAQNSVYEEMHSPTTDSNGILIVNIGEGTVVSGIFNDINWEADAHFLNVKIDTGSGFVDLGTTQFSAVPYAFHAKKAANVKGLEAIDEGNGIGWRLVDRNSDNYDNIGSNAVDLSFVDDPNLGLGATGSYAFCLGHNGTASGEHALAIGNQNYSLNDYAIALGNNNTVSGLNSTAIGGINQVSGDYAFAAGLQNEASGNYSTAIGQNVTASGNTAIALGNSSIAVGNNSLSFGYQSLSSSAYSTAIGPNVIADGLRSTAIGYGAHGIGARSIAIGYDTEASGLTSTAIGNHTRSSARNGFAVGAYNIGGGDPSNFVPTDPIFEIGNGIDIDERSNAVTVLRNGNVGIGTIIPQELLHLSGGRLRIGTETIEDTGNNRLSFNADLLPDVNEAMQLGNSSFRWQGLWATDGTINTSDRRDKTNIKAINYGLNEVLKMNPVSFNWKNRKDHDIKLGLIAQDLLKLIPEVVKTHDWQTTSDDENAPLKKVELDRLGVYYSDLIPVLINAIKEQQEEIKSLQSIIKNQEKKDLEQSNTLEVLLTRVNALEQNINK